MSIEEVAFITGSLGRLHSAGNFLSHISRGNAGEHFQVGCVDVLPVLFNAGPSFLPWDDLSYKGHTSSTEDYRRAGAVDLHVCAGAPHLELVSFRRMFTFSLVFLTCSL